MNEIFNIKDKKFYVLALIVLSAIIFSCSSKSQKKISTNDTVDVLRTAISSDAFKKGFKGLNYKIDTIYFIKSLRYGSQSWPAYLAPFHIKYIDDSESVRKPISSTTDDQRERLGISKLEFQGDSVHLAIFNFSANRDDHFIMVKAGSRWTIKKAFYGVN